MADIIRRDPFANVRQVMDRFFDDSLRRWPAGDGFGGGGRGAAEGALPLDVSRSDGEIKVRASLPGFRKEDIDVQVHEGVLSIKAERAAENGTQDERYYRRERARGSVSRRIALPGIVHDARVDAQLADGVLTLTLPLPAQAQPQQIEIRSA